MLIDTHAHLNFKDFQKDLDKIVQRSVEAGVKKIICVSSNLEDSKKSIQTAKKYPSTVFAAVGIHPHNTSSNHYDTSMYRSEIKRQIKLLQKFAQKKEVVAIGECGLDYSPAPPARLPASPSRGEPARQGEKDRSKEEQLFLFKEQIKLAIQLDKPILVHSRKAFGDTVEILKKYFSRAASEDKAPPRGKAFAHPRGESSAKTTPEVCKGTLPADRQVSPVWGNLKGIFHCYAGGKKGIEKVNQLGFYFGVDGNLTYDEGLQNVFSQIPLEKTLLETDCPYLAPEPFRSQRSEPAHIKIIANCLAKIKKIPFNKVEQTTTQNAGKLFGI
ncbi:TatD family hydrolase [Patescibacteria group bacterium]